jgi:hypothetical protein
MFCGVTVGLPDRCLPIWRATTRVHRSYPPPVPKPMIRFTVLPAKAPAGDCAARLRRSSRPRPRKPCPSRARWLISPSPATGSSEGARPSAFEMTHEPPPRMRIGAICAFVILTPYAAPLLGPLSRPPGLRGKNAGRDCAANCAAAVYRRRSGSARAQVISCGVSVRPVASDRASDRGWHQPPARNRPRSIAATISGRTWRCGSHDRSDRRSPSRSWPQRTARPN